MKDTATNAATDAADSDADAAATGRKKRRRRRWLIVLLVVVCYAFYAYWPPDNRIVVSRETTYLTGPLKADGSVNYIAAVRQRLSEGVTLENNAAPLLLRALGPGLLKDFDLPAVLAELGMTMADLPEDGDYFIRVKDYAETLPPEQAEALLAEDDYAFSPAYIATQWLPEEYPQLAAWLTRNDEALDAVVEAVRRPRLHFPSMLDDDAPLWDFKLPELSVYRRVAFALRARAMLKLAQGNTEAAWHDILACHRLAGLVAQDSFLICDLVSYGLDLIASKEARLLLTSGSMPPEQLRAMLADLKALPPAPHPADSFECERIFSLGFLLEIRRAGYPTGMFNAGPRLGNPWAMRAIDWNLVLKEHNVLFDEIIAAMKIDDPADAQTDLARIEAEVQTWQGWWCQNTFLKIRAKLDRDRKCPGFGEDRIPWAAWRARLGGRPFRNSSSRGMARTMQQLLLPEADRIRSVYDQTTMRREMVELAVGLELYKHAHGEYPATLEELLPAHAGQVPIDCYSGEAVRYVRTADMCKVYSLGQNETDDGGFDYHNDFVAPNSNDDYKLDPDAVMPEGMTEDADDIVIELGRVEQ